MLFAFIGSNYLTSGDLRHISFNRWGRLFTSVGPLLHPLLMFLARKKWMKLISITFIPFVWKHSCVASVRGNATIFTLFSVSEAFSPVIGTEENKTASHKVHLATVWVMCRFWVFGLLAVGVAPLDRRAKPFSRCISSS